MIQASKEMCSIGIRKIKITLVLEVLYIEIGTRTNCYNLFIRQKCSGGFLFSYSGFVQTPSGDSRRFLRVSMGWWLLRLSAKILAILRLSVNFFQLRLTKKLKINFFCFKKLNIN